MYLYYVTKSSIRQEVSYYHVTNQKCNSVYHCCSPNDIRMWQAEETTCGSAATTKMDIKL